jgi:hypothetical protein
MAKTKIYFKGKEYKIEEQLLAEATSAIQERLETIADEADTFFGATFSDGAVLSWDEVLLPENGIKYEYHPEGILDEMIEAYVFADSMALTSASIPDNITEINVGAFWSCVALESIKLPRSLQYISDETFRTCVVLSSITIPSSVTYIGQQAFFKCVALTTITFEGTMEEWAAIQKGNMWNREVPATEVICSDGTVTL